MAESFKRIGEGNEQGDDAHRVPDREDEITLEDLQRQRGICCEWPTEKKAPEWLNVTLMPHQLQALDWLIWREQQTPAGGILADDMGAGKTLTMISLVMKQREVTNVSSVDEQRQLQGSGLVRSPATLVVCPASLIHHWKGEIWKSCRPGVMDKMIVYRSSTRENVNELAANDFVLTSYETAISAMAGETSDLSKIMWTRLILDDAHLIRNPKTARAKAVCRLHARFRWAVTGIPIHNHVTDMFSLLRFIRCSPFDDAWRKEVEKDPLNLEAVVLRRLAEEHPSRYVHVIRMELSKDDRRKYDEYENMPSEVLSKLSRLLRLRQCCVHPSLARGDKHEDRSATEGMMAMGLDENLTSSTKIAWLLKLLNDLKKKEDPLKCVVVSEWAEALDIVRRHLEKGHFRYEVVEGATSSLERLGIESLFSNRDFGAEVLLLSLKTTGARFDLSFATHLVFLEPNWNPIWEKVVISQLYRIGQKSRTVIYFPFCKGTVEERVVVLQNRKTDMAKQTLMDSCDGYELTDPDVEKLIRKEHAVEACMEVKLRLW